jgi:hypothetical protein
MQRRRPYVWLFLGLWAIAAITFWLLMDWNAYYDRGNGWEVKFTLPIWLQLIISSIVASAGAAIVSTIAYLILAPRPN